MPVVVAQAALESNFGKSELASKHNNLFGIKGSYKGQFVEYETTEQDANGNFFTVVDRFRSYPSWEDCFDDYAHIIESLPWYSDAADASNSPTDFLRGILVLRDESGNVIEPGWATDLSYYDKVWSIIGQYHLLERREEQEEEPTKLLQIYEGNRRLDLEVIKQTVGPLTHGDGLKLMVRVKETTFLQRLKYLLSW